MNAWVDFVGHRPSFARILLREVADASPDLPPTLLRHTQPFVSLVQREVYDREEGTGPLKDTGIDPIHVASTVAGATVFFVAAMPALVAGPRRGSLEPRAPRDPPRPGAARRAAPAGDPRPEAVTRGC